LTAGILVKGTSAMANTTVYTVSGMHCEHCVAAVTEEISQLSGVEQVNVEMAGGESTVAVTSVAPLPEDAVRAAVDEAGYTLTGVSG
jgi:copper chaperone